MRPFDLLEQQLKPPPQLPQPAESTLQLPAVRDEKEVKPPSEAVVCAVAAAAGSISCTASHSTALSTPPSAKPFFALAVGHVIDPSRVFAASISLGPLHAHTHAPLRFTQARRSSPLLRRELASILAAAARAVPAGVAVFFTSYAVENDFVEFLRTHAAADGTRVIGAGKEGGEGTMWAAIDNLKQVRTRTRNDLEGNTT